jgi:hypothetical protein
VTTLFCNSHAGHKIAERIMRTIDPVIGRRLRLRRRKPRLSALAWSGNHGTTRRRRRAARPAGHRRGRTATERSSPDAHPLAVATLSPVVGDPVQCRPRHREQSHRCYWLGLFTGSWLVRIRRTAGRAADRRNPENTGAVAGALYRISGRRRRFRIETSPA